MFPGCIRTEVMSVTSLCLGMVDLTPSQPQSILWMPAHLSTSQRVRVRGASIPIPLQGYLPVCDGHVTAPTRTGYRGEGGDGGAAGL